MQRLTRRRVSQPHAIRQELHSRVCFSDVAGFPAGDLGGWKLIRKECEAPNCEEFGE